jgi:hypothetical protein
MNPSRPRLEESNKYSQFLTNIEQRPIIDSHVKSLAAEMKLRGFLPSKPVQVMRDGNNYRVVDGHHRIAAAEMIGIKFWFVVEPAASQDTMAPVNTLVRKWAIGDFVRLYAVRGVKDYQELMRYSEMGIPVAMAASLLVGHSAASGNATTSVLNGTFKVKDREKIDWISALILKASLRNPVVKHRAFIDAISQCLFHPHFDRERFLKRFEVDPLLISKASSTDQQLDQIEEAYNFRMQGKWPLAFEVRKNSRLRKANFGSPEEPEGNKEVAA